LALSSAVSPESPVLGHMVCEYSSVAG